MFSVSNYEKLISKDPIDEAKVREQVQKSRNNIHLVHQILAHNYLILSSNSRFSIKKTNALYVTRLLMETCQFVTITLIQVYLLPQIQKIATLHQQPNNHRIFSKNKYANKSSECLIAIDILLLGQYIKPNKMFQVHQLTCPSNFYTAFNRVKKLVNVNENIKEKWNYRKVFLQNIGKFNQKYRQFMNYFLQKTAVFIKNGPKFKQTLSILPLLRQNRGYINSQVIGLCVQFLQKSFSQQYKCTALMLIGQLVIYGDIQTILMINYSDVLQKLVNRFVIDKENSKFKRDLLWYIQLWAQLLPYDNIFQKQNRKPSLVHSMYTVIKQGGEVFSKNKFTSSMKRQFDENMKANEQRNNKIIQELYLVNIMGQSSYDSSFSVLRSDNVHYMKLREKVIAASQLLKMEITNTNSIVNAKDKLQSLEEQIKNQLQLISALPDENKKDEIELQGQQCLQKIRTFMSLYDKHQHNHTELSKQILSKIIISQSYYKNIKVQPSYESGKYFFDSSSQQSINSLKSIIHKKYTNININKQDNLTKLSTGLQSVEVNYQKLLADSQQIVNVSNEPSINSYHQELLDKSNPTFKQCSEISSILIQTNERQARFQSTLINETQLMHSPYKYKNSRSKMKSKKKDNILKQIYESDSIQVMNTLVHERVNAEKREKLRSERRLKENKVESPLKKKQKITTQSELDCQTISQNEVLFECINDYDEKTKKKLMKDKVRIVKNENVEIGSKVERQGSSIRVTYFITPFKLITKFSLQCQNIPQLQIIIYPLEETQLLPNKQYRVFIIVEVLQFSYSLPHVSFTYKWMEENIKAGPSTFETLLPALFIKFIEHMDPHHNGRELLMKSTKKTKTIKINKSILRDNESIHKFVPNLINIKENPKENIYATYCIYRKAHFIIKFVIQLHQHFWIQGASLPSQNQQESQAVLTHYLCMIQKLFSV